MARRRMKAGPLIYVDADACPVKDEVVRVAERHGLVVTFVSNGGLRPSRDPMMRHVVVTKGADAADDWIVENARTNDIVVTADIPLAARTVALGAHVHRHDRQAVHARDDRHGGGDARPEAASARDRREQGLQCELHARDRSRFLGALDQAVRRAMKSAAADAP